MNLTLCDNQQQASRLAAQIIADAIVTQLAQQKVATVALSGGSTPKQCYQHLSAMEIPWVHVGVTLTDERQVPEDHKDSNMRMLREQLFTGHAAQAHLVPLTNLTYDSPFAAVLLGMGEDGHFASIFPDSNDAAAALDKQQPPGCVDITTNASIYSRTTLNLSAINHTTHLLMLAFGEAKRDLLEHSAGLPINVLFAQTRPAVNVIWAP